MTGASSGWWSLSCCLVTGEYSGCRAHHFEWLLVEIYCQSILLWAQLDSWPLLRWQPGGRWLSLLRRWGIAPLHIFWTRGWSQNQRHLLRWLLWHRPCRSADVYRNLGLLFQGKQQPRIGYDGLVEGSAFRVYLPVVILTQGRSIWCGRGSLEISVLDFFYIRLCVGGKRRWRKEELRIWWREGVVWSKSGGFRVSDDDLQTHQDRHTA